MVFPWPSPDEDEQRKVRELCAKAREIGSRIDHRQVEVLHRALGDEAGYAQVAVLSRVTAIFEDQGVEASGQERFIADSFCTRAAGRVRSQLRQIESNDDERMTAIAKLAYKRGEYGYALFSD